MFEASTLPDELITSFINDAVGAISYIPFNIKRHPVSTDRRVTIYSVPDAMVNVISVLYYPESGSFLTSAITESTTNIPVQTPSIFSGKQFAQIGYPPNYEIINISNGLGNAQRGQQGTVAQAWAAGTPIRVWTTAIRWTPLTSQNIYTSLQGLAESSTSVEPTRYTWSNNTIILDRPPNWIGAHNLLVYGHTRPPLLMDASDTVEGLPPQFATAVAYYAVANLLVSFGGEGMQKADLYFRLYLEAVDRLNQWSIDQYGNTGLTSGYTGNIGRTSLGVIPQR